MRVTLMLADYAQAADGKLNVIGAGWTLTGPNPTPSAIGILFEVPWDRANESIPFRLELVDADGNPFVGSSGGAEPQALIIDASFEVGRPAGLKPGTPLTFAAAINLTPQPLVPGTRYEWRLTVADESHEDWRLPFSVRPTAS